MAKAARPANGSGNRRPRRGSVAVLLASVLTLSPGLAGCGGVIGPASPGPAGSAYEWRRDHGPTAMPGIDTRFYPPGGRGA